MLNETSAQKNEIVVLRIITAVMCLKQKICVKHSPALPPYFAMNSKNVYKVYFLFYRNHIVHISKASHGQVYCRFIVFFGKTFDLFGPDGLLIFQNDAKVQLTI